MLVKTGRRILDCVDKIVERYLRFRNLTIIQLTHSTDDSFHRWYHRDGNWRYL